MKFLYPYFFIFLLLSGCGKRPEPLLPGEFTVSAVLSTNTLFVGDPVTLTLRARHPSGSTVLFPHIGNGKETVVQERSSARRELTKSILESEEIYRLTSFRTGNWTLTTNPAACTFPDGEQKIHVLPELVLHVQSSLTETNATLLSDIKDIVSPPMHIPRTVWIPLLIALLALLAGLLTLVFLRRRNAEPQIAAPPQPPHIIAQKALQALRGKPWSPEPFFTELSLILRTYLENRFSLNAPESTTEELTRSMAADSRLAVKEQQTLRSFLTQADLVKFARAGAEQPVMQNAFSTVEQFIDQTTPSDQTDSPDSK